MVKIIYYFLIFIMWVLNLVTGFIGLIGIISLITFRWDIFLYSLLYGTIIGIFQVGLATIVNEIQHDE